jgi:lipid-binding SYLF domain-containing protein
MLKNKLLLVLPAALWLSLTMPVEAGAQSDNSQINAETGDQAERALHAANVIRQLVNAPESNIPEELLERAHAIAVIPNIIKAAFGVGGLHGKGLVAKRNPNGWGTPAFIDLNGGSFGFQIGVSATDLILVFTREDGLKGLLEDKLELGGEAGVAAGPIGRAAEAGTNLTFDSPIYSYSRSKGLFAGIALKGSVMTIDDSANRRVYGSNVTGTDILLGERVTSTAVVKPFVEALNTYDPATRSAHKLGPQPPPQDAVTASNIRKAQESLRERGYSPGPIDGTLGVETRAAISKFQVSEKLPVTGQLDAQTAARLGVQPERL